MKLSIIFSKEEYKRREIIRVKKAYKEKYKEKYQKKYQEKLKLEGKLTKKDEISQRRQKIKALLQQGFKQKDICLSLNISKDTYICDRKYLKEQGLI